MDNKKTVRHERADSAKVISVIAVELTVGAGVDDDPVRKVTEYWSLSGERLAVNDPYYAGGMERASSKASSASI